MIFRESNSLYNRNLNNYQYNPNIINIQYKEQYHKPSHKRQNYQDNQIFHQKEKFKNHINKSANI